MISKFNTYITESIRDMMTGVSKDDIDMSKIDEYDIKPLLDIGFTTEELLEIKKRYKERDLQYFSQEQIRNSNLLDRIEMRGDTLVKLDITKDDILNKTVFDRIIPKTLNLIALMGVSWNGILHAFHHKNIWIGVSITLLMYIITYLAPTQMIPYVITKVQNKIDTYKPINIDIKLYNKTIHLEDYLAGIVLIFFLVLIEFIAISLYINFAKTL